METSRPDDPAYLTFKVFTADQGFKNYTDPGVLRDDFTLFFENGESAPASGHHDPAGASPEKVDPPNITYRCEKIPGERTSPGKKTPLPIP